MNYEFVLIQLKRSTLRVPLRTERLEQQLTQPFCSSEYYHCLVALQNIKLWHAMILSVGTI